MLPSTATTVAQQTPPALHKSTFARVAASLTIFSSALIIAGYFLPWVEDYSSSFDQSSLSFSGVTLALASFQNGNQFTLEAFAAFTLVILPLIFASFILALGITSLVRPLSLGLQSLSVACAVVNVFSVSSINALFIGFIFQTKHASVGLALGSVVLGSLIQVISTILTSKIALLGASAPTQRRITTAALFSLLGGACAIGDYFVPTSLLLREASPTGKLYSYYSPWLTFTSIINDHANQGWLLINQSFNALLPLILALLALGIGITLSFRKPGAVIYSLYALPILLGLNATASVGYYYFQILDMYNATFPRTELGFGQALNVLAYTLILAGAVALVMQYVRARQSRPIP